MAKEAAQGLLGVVSSYSRGDMGGMFSAGKDFWKKFTTGEEAHSRSLATKTSPADVVMFSGSKDDQTSWVSPFSHTCYSHLHGPSLHLPFPTPFA